MIRTANGRPLRFFAMVMMGWVAIRLASQEAILPPVQQPYADGRPVPAPAPALLPQAVLASSAVATLPRLETLSSQPLPHIAPRTKTETFGPPPSSNAAMPVDLMDFISFTVAFANRHYASDPEYMSRFQTPTASPSPLITEQKTPDRWRAAAWLLWRPGGARPSGTVPTGQLGGSQTGLRVDYDLTPRASSSTVAYGRLTRALQRPTASEGAVGLSIQPMRAIPISVAVERRIALGNGARNANAVMAVGGFGPVVIAPGVVAEGYGQTGIVGFRRGDAFIDGKFSLSTPLGQSPIRVGAALSGGAQPGVSRLDIGPLVQFRLPLPTVGARIAIEWRERIAGGARPGSGLAITLAADF
ncbi:hypothetical protein HHL08_14995 [Sphingobium sp. AR-3-1]|uniref:Uncharacterized protein n=1 Tax=Sphingobium psychrophilum TaxID=2728834 RepID=A0A7X9ZUM2_9SPHN|nr:hypothetical protein [Sphingobium psychrophilum]NML11439.1 hypothetical protein [Sphingobium psychrophilum]